MHHIPQQNDVHQEQKSEYDLVRNCLSYRPQPSHNPVFRTPTPASPKPSKHLSPE